jgi:hypothetical protein
MKQRLATLVFVAVLVNSIAIGILATLIGLARFFRCCWGGG